MTSGSLFSNWPLQFRLALAACTLVIVAGCSKQSGPPRYTTNKPTASFIP